MKKKVFAFILLENIQNTDRAVSSLRWSKGWLTGMIHLPESFHREVLRPPSAWSLERFGRESRSRKSA